ncbi:hypothetical protein TNCV_4862681 [Trichonephila clavipes]|nr:hypothetical protein TNCV_4862681 [Trichonephila clavipes]
MRTTPEHAPPLLTTTPHQREDSFYQMQLVRVVLTLLDKATRGLLATDLSQETRTTPELVLVSPCYPTIPTGGQWMTVYFWVPGLINRPQSHIMMSVMQT